MRTRGRMIVIGLLLAADQLSKQLLQDTHSPLIPGLIGISGVRNTGAAFGMLGGSTWLLALVSAAASLLMLYYLQRHKPRGLFGLGLTLMLAGALGNLIDRVFLGYVIDFLELQFMRFAVFNLADVYVSLGTLLALIGLLGQKEAAHG